MQFLREEIAKKNAQLQTANREYKAALESRSEHAARSANFDNQHITRLESELTDIKRMLNEFGYRSEKDKLTHLLEDDAENSDTNSVDFVKQQKALIKEQ